MSGGGRVPEQASSAVVGAVGPVKGKSRIRVQMTPHITLQQFVCACTFMRTAWMPRSEHTAPRAV